MGQIFWSDPCEALFVRAPSLAAFCAGAFSRLDFYALSGVDAQITHVDVEGVPVLLGLALVASVPTGLAGGDLVIQVMLDQGE